MLFSEHSLQSKNKHQIMNVYTKMELLKQLILDQTRQNGYQTIPFSVYIRNLMFVFTLEWVFWKQPRYGCDFITYMYQLLIANVFWPEKANTWPN